MTNVFIMSCHGRADPDSGHRNGNIGAIKDAFQARKIFVVRGVLLNGGPDHYARIEAGKLVLRLICLRR